MLVTSYRLEIFNNECMPHAMSVQCFAHLDQDVGAALPYVNGVLGGFEYIKEPPSVTFRIQGKLLSIHSRKIAINALRDQAEATKIVEWLIREINEAWEQREQIQPSFSGLPRVEFLKVLKLLPKTNCQECGCPTCTVFAVKLAEGAKALSDCPQLEPESVAQLTEYINPAPVDWTTL